MYRSTLSKAAKQFNRLSVVNTHISQQYTHSHGTPPPGIHPNPPIVQAMPYPSCLPLPTDSGLPGHKGPPLLLPCYFLLNHPIRSSSPRSSSLLHPFPSGTLAFGLQVLTPSPTFPPQFLIIWCRVGSSSNPPCGLWSFCSTCGTKGGGFHFRNNIYYPRPCSLVRTTLWKFDQLQHVSPPPPPAPPPPLLSSPFPFPHSPIFPSPFFLSSPFYPPPPLSPPSSPSCCLSFPFSPSGLPRPGCHGWSKVILQWAAALPGRDWLHFRPTSPCGFDFNMHFDNIWNYYGQLNNHHGFFHKMNFNLHLTWQQLQRLPSDGPHLQESHVGCHHLERFDLGCWNTLDLDHRDSDNRKSTLAISASRTSPPRSTGGQNGHQIFGTFLIRHWSTFFLLPPRGPFVCILDAPSSNHWLRSSLSLASLALLTGAGLA